VNPFLKQTFYAHYLFLLHICAMHYVNFKEIILNCFAWFKVMTGEGLSSAALHSHRKNATVIVPHFWQPNEPVRNR